MTSLLYKVKYYLGLPWYVYYWLVKELALTRDANPEVLVDLSQRALPTTTEDLDSLNAQFSRVMAFLKIDAIYKVTWPGRLKITEEILIRYFQHAQNKQITFLDLGASDGITTWEAVTTLNQHLDCEVKAWLADLHPWLYRYRIGPIIEYRGSDGEPILLRLGRHCVRLYEDLDSLVVKNYLIRLCWFRGLMKPAGRISLLNPLAASDPRISVQVADCLKFQISFNERFDIIRASNILVRNYFSEDQLQIALKHLYRYLKLNGLLILSDNDLIDGVEIPSGTVWRKEESGLRYLEDFGRGYENKRLVEDYVNNGVHLYNSLNQ